MHREVADADEIAGINDRIQLSQCETALQERLKRHWMAEGVSFVDPASCTLSEDCRFGQDVVVEPQCHFRGSSSIGDGCRIGPGCLIEDSSLGAGATVLYSVLRQVQVAERCSIGPFAQLRPGTSLAENCHIGNFVEVKNSSLANGVKVNHLSYIGDADLGAGVNVGAGTITANYDGVRTHRTVVGAGSKTGAQALSHREHQVYRLLTQGHSVSDIGAQLGLAANTVSTYRARILEKTGTKNDVELALYAERHPSR